MTTASTILEHSVRFKSEDFDFIRLDPDPISTFTLDRWWSSITNLKAGYGEKKEAPRPNLATGLALPKSRTVLNYGQHTSSIAI